LAKKKLKDVLDKKPKRPEKKDWSYGKGWIGTKSSSLREMNDGARPLSDDDHIRWHLNAKYGKGKPKTDKLDARMMHRDMASKVANRRRPNTKG
jgi:hypothetical protein